MKYSPYSFGSPSITAKALGIGLSSFLGKSLARKFFKSSMTAMTRLRLSVPSMSAWALASVRERLMQPMVDLKPLAGWM